MVVVTRHNMSAEQPPWQTGQPKGCPAGYTVVNGKDNNSQNGCMHSTPAGQDACTTGHTAQAGHPWQRRANRSQSQPGKPGKGSGKRQSGGSPSNQNPDVEAILRQVREVLHQGQSYREQQAQPKARPPAKGKGKGKGKSPAGSGESPSSAGSPSPSSKGSGSDARSAERWSHRQAEWICDCKTSNFLAKTQCRACGKAKPAQPEMLPAGSAPWSTRAEGPRSKPAPDAERDKLVAALDAAEAAGLTEVRDQIRGKLDALHQQREDALPLEDKIAKARAAATKLSAQADAAQTKLGELQAQLDAQRSLLVALSQERDAAQGALNALVAQRPPPAAAPPADGAPAYAPPPVLLAQLITMLDHMPDLPVAVRSQMDVVKRAHSAPPPTTPTGQPAPATPSAGQPAADVAATPATGDPAAGIPATPPGTQELTVKQGRELAAEFSSPAKLPRTN